MKKLGRTDEGNSHFDILVKDRGFGERLLYLGFLCLFHRCSSFSRKKNRFVSNCYKGELLKLVILKHFDLH